MSLSTYTLALLAGGVSAQAPQQCTIELATANRQCPSPACVPPQPCANGQMPPDVPEIDPNSQIGCCLKPCNYICDGDPSDLCAGWSWPPPGSRNCQNTQQCYPGEECECQSSSCECDPTTGQAAGCTDDCIMTCRGGMLTRMPDPDRSCGHNNGNCPDGTECKEIEVQCLIPPCEVEITCADAEGNVILQLFKGHMESPVMFVEWRQNSQGGGTLVSLDGHGNTLVWEGPSGNTLNSIAAQPEGVVAPWSPDTMNVAVGRDRGVFVYPALDSTTTPTVPLFEIPSPTGASVGDVIWVSTQSAGNSQNPILAVAWGNTVSIFDGANGRPTGVEFTSHTELVTSLSAHPANNMIFSGSWDGTAKSWDLNTGSEVMSFPGHTGGVTMVRVSPDGMYLATGVQDKLVMVYNADAGTSVSTFSGHEGTSVLWTGTPWVKGARLDPENASRLPPVPRTALCSCGPILNRSHGRCLCSEG